MGEVTGLGPLFGLAVRTSRWFWAVWLVVMVAIVPATARAYGALIPDPSQAETTIASLTSNPTMRAMLGPPFDLTSAGPFTVWRVGTFLAALAGVMAILGVVRATRGEEENGRTELVRAGIVDRHAPLGAALLLGLGACLTLGVLVTLVMVAIGEPVAGSLAFGAGMTLVPAVFVGVAAVAAQLAGTARGARGIAMAVLGAAFLVRAVADGSSADSALRPLQWVSPVEWLALARPYASERWWVLVLPLALAAGLVWLAVRLESRRDHGSGLRAARPGPAVGHPRLSSVAALAWRLDRGSVLGWAVGLGITCLAMGSLVGSLGQMFTDNPRLEEMFRRMGGDAGQLTDAFFAAMLSIVAVVTALVGVSLLGRLAREERVGHAELLLATGASRRRFALAHLLPALMVPSALLMGGSALLALPETLAQSDAGVLAEVVAAAAVLLPGAWLVVGLAMALHGVASRLGVLAWAVVGWSMVMTWVGPVLGLPEWLTRLTPWVPLPRLPAEDLTWWPVLLVTGAAAVLCGVGLLAFQRRDLDTV